MPSVLIVSTRDPDFQYKYARTMALYGMVFVTNGVAPESPKP